MEQACQADNSARESGQPALHKLKLLPEVTGLLNRNDVQHAVLDPDTNFLQHVKFFLEPLNDGSLPAYNIQRDIFSALAKLNVQKEALLSSGIGRVVVFYTRSKKPEPSIKRIAQRLLGEWSRPILKRTDDYKKRQIETREFDYEYVFALLTSSNGVLIVILGPPSWLNVKRQTRSSASPSALHSLPGISSASVSSPRHAPTTRLAWSTCHQATPSHPRARTLEPVTRTTARWVLEAWMPSASLPRRARRRTTKPMLVETWHRFLGWKHVLARIQVVSY